MHKGAHKNIYVKNDLRDKIIEISVKENRSFSNVIEVLCMEAIKLRESKKEDKND